MKGVVFVVYALLVSSAFADLYLHTPRGSNDRANEANVNRNNNNRIFDSQNNAKGGYASGTEQAMSFLTGSTIPIEYTAQHGSGGTPTLYDNIVIQYACSTKDAEATARIRDGTNTNTVPANAAGAADQQFGLHEPLASYQECANRQRNQGLFTADQNVGAKATATRQNPNAQRSGLECAEERDYYPYWHPSVWKDAAILTDNLAYCAFYQQNSQNVAAKGHCLTQANAPTATQNNEAACTAAGNKWVVQAAWGIAPPACELPQTTRENHNGNAAGAAANTSSWTWTIPATEPCTTSAAGCACVTRVRYNISITDVGNAPAASLGAFTTAAANGNKSPVKNDPKVTVAGQTLQLALNTAQTARTFQDRSHVFSIAPRPANIPASAVIQNIGVRGKRGNIVQVYPAVEYDFVPQNVTVAAGAYVHFQWTGSNNNPQGNDGEGKAGTDRSNVVQLSTQSSAYPATDAWIAANPSKVLIASATARAGLAFLGQTGCAANPANDQANNNCQKLNAAKAYYNAGPQQVSNVGEFAYMSTRNNNFSNRDQKGHITVTA